MRILRYKLSALCFLVAIVSASLSSRAQELQVGDLVNESDSVSFRPVVSSYFAEWGQTSAFDSYLSPLKYSGNCVALGAEWRKLMNTKENRWTSRFDLMLSSAFMGYRSLPVSLYDFSLFFGWNAMRSFPITSDLVLSGGAGAALECGALYMPSNSNNPASARASVDFTFNAEVSYRLRIGKYSVRVTDVVRLPFIGAFFSPQYGEPYYEIYLGNHSGLVHCGWWGNHFAINNLVSAEFPVSKVHLRLGYRFHCRSSYVCSLNSRIVSHTIVLGIVTDGFSLSPLKKVSAKSTLFYPY